MHKFITMHTIITINKFITIHKLSPIHKFITMFMFTKHLMSGTGDRLRPNLWKSSHSLGKGGHPRIVKRFR